MQQPQIACTSVTQHVALYVIILWCAQNKRLTCWLLSKDWSHSCLSW